MSARVVVVGASLAGASAVAGLREHGYDGRLTLLGDESERPYERPALSKDYLLGRADRESVFVHAAEWYAENDVELRLGTEAIGLDRAHRRVVLAGGERLPYDAVLLATGSSPRRLEVPGADLDGVHYLRRLGDADSLKAALAAGAARVVVVGAGWIGLEAAAAARAAGVDVTVLENADLPLLRVLGPEVAAIFADLHRRNGVHLLTGVQVAEITGTEGAVTGVRLADGVLLPADLVVVGVGVTPNDAGQGGRARGGQRGHGRRAPPHRRPPGVRRG